MATPLKYMYNPAYFEKLCPVLAEEIPGFDSREFIFRTFNTEWPDKELKQRVRHIANVLHHFLSKDFVQASRQLVGISDRMRQQYRCQSFENIFLPDYIEVYGMEDPDEALWALGEITRIVSAEYAIRPFIIRYPEKAMAHIYNWSRSDDENVRRLSSEGCRPRLPWGIALQEFKEDPSPVLPVLENLKKDSSLYVRKSVANNINDIAKDHPDVVIALAKRWRGTDPDTDWILRHGCRSLMKKGHEEVLTLQGFNPQSQARIRELLLPPKVKIGDWLNFRFAFVSKEKKPANFRIEYAIDYLTSTGKVSRRVFKIKETLFPPGKTITIQRKQSFRDFTTRKHFPGKHLLSIIANGKKLAATEFIVC